MENLVDEVKDNQEVIVAIRPEEFSIVHESGEGLEMKIKTSTFLGKYNTYEIEALKDDIVENMPALEFSQDIGQATKIYGVGDKLYLKPNSKKINIFTSDGEKSLIKGVEVYVK